MEKEELQRIFIKFFDIYKEYATIELQKFIQDQDSKLLYSVEQLDNIERFLHRWYKYLSVNHNKNTDQTTCRHHFIYNFNSWILTKLVFNVLEDSRFTECVEDLKNHKWIPDVILPVGLRNVKFAHVVEQLILELFSFETTVINLQDLINWDLTLKPDHIQEIEVILDYLLNENFEIDVYYFIFGIKINNSPKVLDSELNLSLKPILPEEISNLTKSLKIQCPYEDRTENLANLSSVNYIAKRKIKIPRFYLEEDNSKQNQEDLIKSKNIFLANHFEEGFHLLGCRNTKIIAYSNTNPYDWLKFEIDFNLDFFQTHVTFGSMKVWDFSHVQTFGGKDEITWSKEIGIFLKEFPKKLLHFPQLSLLSNIFHRHRRLQSASFTYDVVLESMIILDALLTEGVQQLSYQIRMKTPWLLSQNAQERLKWKEIIKILYTLRSKIVHETGTSVKKQIDRFNGYKNIDNYCIEIIQGILLQIIEIKDDSLVFRDIKDLRKTLEEAGLGITDKVKETVLFQKCSKEKIIELALNFQ
jgi:hypothetical protein